MPRRRRKHIPLVELLAAALADKLGAEGVRLRAEQVPAAKVVRLFTADHIRLHAWDGPDRWWNLDMRARGPELKAKDAADTSRVAKVRRIDKTWREFMRATATGRKPPPRKSKSRWPSRPFAKRRKDDGRRSKP